MDAKPKPKPNRRGYRMTLDLPEPLREKLQRIAEANCKYGEAPNLAEAVRMLIWRAPPPRVATAEEWDSWRAPVPSEFQSAPRSGASKTGRRTE